MGTISPSPTNRIKKKFFDEQEDPEEQFADEIEEDEKPCDGKFKMQYISQQTFQFIKNSNKSIVINDLVKKVVDKVYTNPNFKDKINKKWNKKENRSFEHGNV